MKFTLFIIMTLLSAMSCGGKSAKKTVDAEVSAATAAIAPRRYTYCIRNVFPHSEDAYTQGLQWANGKLYEGTGGYGESQLRRVDLPTGTADIAIDLERKYFGEGITLLDGKIYQITWTEGKAFVYDADDFSKRGEFRYTGQGWGLTTDGTKLYMSDGTEKITVRNPETFEAERVIEVRAGRNRVRNLNELEWIEGEIWANVFLSDQVVIINPQTGAVRAIVDFAGLQSTSDQTFRSDVLNGIAYDADTRRIFVTGKRWNKLYEVEIIEKTDKGGR